MKRLTMHDGFCFSKLEIPPEAHVVFNLDHDGFHMAGTFIHEDPVENRAVIGAYMAACYDWLAEQWWRAERAFNDDILWIALCANEATKCLKMGSKYREYGGLPK